MLVIKIEDWPNGNKKLKTEVARLVVRNRTDEEVLTDFEVLTSGEKPEYFHDFTIENFNRKQGVFELMKAIFTRTAQKSS